MTICNQTVYVRPIKDEFYDPDPSAERSSNFAKEKGLVAKAPGGPTLTPSASNVISRSGTPVPNGLPLANGNNGEVLNRAADLRIEN